MKTKRTIRFHEAAPPQLDRAALDQASALSIAVYRLVHETKIEASNSVSWERRAAIAKAALVKLNTLAESRLAEIQSHLAALKDKRRALLTRGGESNAALARQQFELQNAVNCCRQAFQNAQGTIARIGGIK
jgi:hypothetical protein